jgi:hypothetical protein
LHLTIADNKKATAGHISSTIRSMAKSKLEFMGTEGLPECHYMSGEFNFLGAQLSTNLDNPKDVCTTRPAFAGTHSHKPCNLPFQIGYIALVSSICTSDYRIKMRIQEGQKHTDPTDPEHWYIYIILQR